MTTVLPEANADAVKLFHEALAANQANDLNQAFQCLIGAVALDPSLAGAWNNLGMVLNKMRKYPASAAAFARSYHLAPDQILPLANYAWGLQLAGRSKEAARIVFDHVLPREPENVAHYVNLAQVMLTLGYREKALECAEKAFALGDTREEARLALALAQLRLGRYAEGFKNYEARMETNPVLKMLKSYPYPMWRGEDISNSRLFIPCEQGIGDSVMFLPFIKLAAQRARRLTVHVHHPVMSFYKRNLRGSNVEILPIPTELPADVDMFCPSLSLPVALGLSDKEIVEVLHTPLKCAPVRFEKFIKKNPRDIHIGICWAGDPKHDNDKYRSAELDPFLQLAEIPNARLFSLQIGPRANDLDILAAHGSVRNLAPYIRDVNDTAAIIHQYLDIVVSIDSAPAHIAGVMGKRAFVLHGNLSVDWRWQTGEGPSPWYPSMTMIRQLEHESWFEVLATVKNNILHEQTKDPAV